MMMSCLPTEQPPPPQQPQQQQQQQRSATSTALPRIVHCAAARCLLTAAAHGTPASEIHLSTYDALSVTPSVKSRQFHAYCASNCRLDDLRLQQCSVHICIHIRGKHCCRNSRSGYTNFWPLVRPAVSFYRATLC